MTADDKSRALTFLSGWRGGGGIANLNMDMAAGELAAILAEVRRETIEAFATDKACVESWACDTMPHADTLCPHCCPLAWRAKSSPGEHVGPLGNEVTCEWIDRHVARLETSVKEATDESERLREEWTDARDGAKYSRDEHLAALEALEFSTRMATIEECVRACEAVADRLRPYAGTRAAVECAGKIRALREVKP